MQPQKLEEQIQRGACIRLYQSKGESKSDPRLVAREFLLEPFLFPF
jgi:hypothetical protein